MGFLTGLWNGQGLSASTPGPDSDFWYGPVGGVQTAAGIPVDNETARKLSAWYRGRDILATVLAMLPLPLYVRLPNDGGRDVAREHPLYDVLHDKPNSWQDSFQWRRQKMYHLIDHGNGYDRISGGARGLVDSLTPIDPKLVTPEQVSGGAIVYNVRDPKTSRTSKATQAEIFHLRGASDDGVTGKGILAYARENLGTALATESYAANIFSKGTMRAGTVSVPAQMTPESGRAMAQTFVTAAGEWHMPRILPNGATWTPDNMTPEDAQMLLSRKHSVDDIARWLGIPRQMLENSDPSFGNAEQFDENFLTYTMGSWLSLFEFAINAQLVLVPKKYYAEFKRQAFVRAKFAERWRAHVEWVNAGIETPDEARETENMNRRGGKADELREPQNITGKPKAEAPAKEPAKKPAAEDKARAILVSSAGRMVRKETEALSKLAQKFAANTDGWAIGVTEFYAKHVALVVEALQVDEHSARLYCADQCKAAMGDLQALDWHTPEFVERVADWALGIEVAA